MKSLLAITTSIALCATAPGALILTAIYDGQGSTPKGVEIFVTTTGSYNGWTVDQQFNAGTSWSTGYTFDSTTYTVGDFIYLTSTASDATIVATGGTIISDSSFNSNGDDRVRIHDGTNTIDQHGATDTDGTGQPWEYTDSYAYRVSETDATGAFALGDWTYGGPNLLDSGNAPLAAVLGTYEPAAIPEPTTALLGGLGLLALFRRRRA